MPSGLKFRHRIGVLVALAGLALVTVTVVSLLLGRQSERELLNIENRYVPLIELDRDLDVLAAQIPSVLEDAAAAAEESGLAEADRLADELVRRVRAGHAAITDNGGDPRALETTFRAYYTLAREVSSSILEDTPAAQLGTKIEEMRRAHQRFTAERDTATTPDRQRLSAAFATARASQSNALRIEIIVGAGALALMVLLSWQLTRRTVRALAAVSAGVERLARGEFGQEIDAETRDEIGDLAREANRTADRLREYRDTLEARSEELARASRYKSEFLANMSHELRTPLNSIMILSQLLATNGDGGLTAKQVELASVIHKAGEELLALINEVLDLAKVEAGKQELVIEPFAVSELQDYVRRMFQPVATQKGVELVVEAAGDLPAQIRTDRARLAQVLKNLISNAFKFTERGRVTVRLARVAPASLEIAVSDTGIGIAADKHTLIFEAFQQADSGTSRQFGGTGLGLTIAKQLAVRLGGDLSVESQLGTGTTFRLLIPIGVSEPVPAVEPVSTTAIVEISPTLLDDKTVMIVDDDMRNVYSLTSSLRGKNLRILSASDGQEALDELERNPNTDLVLMDITMPGMDGLEAMRRIRAQPPLARLPIIALTARTMPGEREQCLEAGASDYVPKPVDVTRLLEVMQRMLTAGDPGS